MRACPRSIANSPDPEGQGRFNKTVFWHQYIIPAIITENGRLFSPRSNFTVSFYHLVIDKYHTSES